jgi:acyltransferase
VSQTADNLPGEGPPATAEATRLTFLDAARAIAIVLMVFAHFTDQLLDPALHSGTFGALYAATRGFTAPLFFVVSGWSFAVSVMPRARLGTADLPRRVRRGGLLLLWGYLLTLPWWADGFPFTDSTAVWVPFWTAGVLQTLGVSLLIATGLLWWVPRPPVFAGLSAALAVIFFAAAPWLTAHSTHWPAALRGYFDAQSVGGGFPITPWSAYFFAGLALGGGLWVRKAKALEIGGVLVAVAALAWAGSRALAGPDGLLVWRFALVAGVLGSIAVVTSSGLRLPFAIRTLGQHALTFYVAHMVLLWGAPWFPGLVHRLRPELGWVACLALTFGCLGVTAFGIWLLGRTHAAVRFRRSSSKAAG